jgi:hypothetical protein
VDIVSTVEDVGIEEDDGTSVIVEVVGDIEVVIGTVDVAGASVDVVAAEVVGATVVFGTVDVVCAA